MEAHMNRHHEPMVATHSNETSTGSHLVSRAKQSEEAMKVRGKRRYPRRRNRKSGTKEPSSVPEQTCGSSRYIGLSWIASAAVKDEECEGTDTNPHAGDDVLNNPGAYGRTQQGVLEESTCHTIFLSPECSIPSSCMSMNRHDSQESETLPLKARNYMDRLDMLPKQRKGPRSNPLKNDSKPRVPSPSKGSRSPNQPLCLSRHGKQIEDCECACEKNEGSLFHKRMHEGSIQTKKLLQTKPSKRNREDITAASTLWGMLHAHVEGRITPVDPMARSMRNVQTELNQMSLHELVQLLATLSNRTISQVLKLKKGRKKLVEKITNAWQRRVGSSLPKQAKTKPDK